MIVALNGLMQRLGYVAGHPHGFADLRRPRLTEFFSMTKLLLQ